MSIRNDFRQNCICFVSCAGCGTEATKNIVSGTQTRKRLAADGWTRGRYTSDYCPACTAAMWEAASMSNDELAREAREANVFLEANQGVPLSKMTPQATSPHRLAGRGE